jgi:ribosomal protein L22
LKIETIDIGRGPKIKRVRPAGRSRMHWYVKHRAFVRVRLWFVA